MVKWIENRVYRWVTEQPVMGWFYSGTTLAVLVLALVLTSIKALGGLGGWDGAK